MKTYDKYKNRFIKEVIMKLKRILPTIFLLATSISSAHAISITEAIVEDIPFYDPPTAGNIYGEFTVTNDTANDVYLFAVATVDPIMAFSNLGPFSPDSMGWTTVAMTPTEWNTSTLDGSDFWLIQPDNPRRLTTDLGSFNTVFGSEYNGVFLYAYQNELSSRSIAAGATESGFYFESTALGSPYIAYALDASGNPVELISGVSTHVSAVPLPAAAWLFITGLVSMGVMGRRRLG